MKPVPLKKALFEEAKSLGISQVSLHLSVDEENTFEIRVTANPITPATELFRGGVWFWASKAYKDYKNHADYVDAEAYGHVINYNIAKGTMNSQGWQTVASYEPIKQFDMETV